jgi:hypothetical protein
MLQDLMMICQRILVTAGSAITLLIAAAASKYLSRLMLRLARKAMRTRRYVLDVGNVHVEVVVAISGTPVGRKSLPDADTQ